MKSENRSIAPLILFGAFDRHNFGDLLFPHIAEKLLPHRRLLFAGLVERDLRPCGGHRVHALARLARRVGHRVPDLLHVGGELLTCDAWEAAVMLLSPGEAQEVIRRLDRQPRQRYEWAHKSLGVRSNAPYIAGRDLFPDAGAICCTALGGVDLDQRSASMKAEVIHRLHAADEVSVRDKHTRGLLGMAGIDVQLSPDPAVLIAELFGEEISLRMQGAAIASVRNIFPAGYLAVQFSADFGDDAMLEELAAQLDRAARVSGLGIAFFRAGAAPWHDDLESYRRIASRMHAATHIFGSLHLWDICALIAGSRGFAGSSLHGRIVAMACALPRVSLVRSAAGVTKQEAYCASWEIPDIPATVEAPALADGMLAALASDRPRLEKLAKDLATAYRAAFRRSRLALG